MILSLDKIIYRACKPSAAARVLILAGCFVVTALPGAGGPEPRQEAESGQGLEQDVDLASGTEVTMQVYPASGKRMVIWLASEHGRQSAETDAAKQLATAGVEVWMPDLLQAHFLAPLFSSMAKIPATDIADLIDLAHGKTGKTVCLVSAGRGAMPVLQGAALWRRRSAGVQDPRVLAGAVLLYPNLDVATPEPGQEARYLPVVYHSRLRIGVLQPALSPWAWWLEIQQQALEQGGATVFNQVLKGVRNRFHFRPDATAAETALAGKLAELLQTMLAKVCTQVSLAP